MKANILLITKLVTLFIVTFILSFFLVELAFRFQIQSQFSLKMFGVSDNNFFENLSWESARTLFEIAFQSIAFLVLGYLTRLSTKLKITTAGIIFLAAHLSLRAGFSITQAMSLINNLCLASTASMFFLLGYKIKIVEIVNKFKNGNASKAGTDAA